MYFTRFNPIFPIIHVPTFRLSRKSSLLLLSICSLGSLLLGSDWAAMHGRNIFDRVSQTALASVRTCVHPAQVFENPSFTEFSQVGPPHITREARSTHPTSIGVDRTYLRTFVRSTWYMQALAIKFHIDIFPIIWQSQRPRDLLTVQSFHGTVIAVWYPYVFLCFRSIFIETVTYWLNPKWAKKLGIFKQQARAEDEICDMLDHDLEFTWKSWAQIEEQKRWAKCIR